MYTLEEWFIKLDLLQMMIKIIATSYTKQDMELVAHILNSLPRQYSEVVTNIEGLNNLALVDVKAKLRLFYQQRMKVEKPGELALAVYTNFKHICHTCSKQGHKASNCQVKKMIQVNKLTTNEGVKCFNCNKHAGHIAEDCPEPKKERSKSSTKETGMFVGCCMFDNDYKANEDPKEVNKTETKESNNNEESKNEFMFVGIVRKLLWRKHYLRFVPLLPHIKTGWLILEQWHT